MRCRGHVHESPTAVPRCRQGVSRVSNGWKLCCEPASTGAATSLGLFGAWSELRGGTLSATHTTGRLADVASRVKMVRRG